MKWVKALQNLLIKFGSNFSWDKWTYYSFYCRSFAEFTELKEAANLLEIADVARKQVLYFLTQLVAQSLFLVVAENGLIMLGYFFQIKQKII